jgi:Flp pilus assembly protein CpaB
MEANRHFGKSASGGRKQGLNNRPTAILVAAVSAVLAAALIYLFVTHYHKSAPVAAVTPQSATVWEAAQYIPANTPQSQIAAGGFLKSEVVPVSQVVVGAITDPSVVAGQATSVAVEKGQQITASDFTRTPVNEITTYLKGDQRGVAFTFDSEHGLTSYLQPNDTVDVMATSGGSTELLVKDITVIANTGGNVVLRLTDKQALLVTAASGKYALWLTMRPAIKATNSVQVGAVGSAGTIG